MSRYEVELQLYATVWIDVEADNEDAAEAYARETYRISDAQYHDIADVSVKMYHDPAVTP